MNVSFDYNEMKNFISKTGKYKIANVKCFNLIPANWYSRFKYEEEEIEIEVAYLTDDIESEKWIFDKAYMKRKEDYYMFTIESAFYREFKSKLLNL